MFQIYNSLHTLAYIYTNSIPYNYYLFFYNFCTITAQAGQRIVGEDGTVYEVVVDPLTGKKYKK